MKFKDDYGKDILILDEENLIYKNFFRKIVIKRSDIRSVFYDEEILGILTYSGKIYSLVIRKLLFSERKRLEELRLEVSKENILFDYTNSLNSEMYLLFIVFFNIINIMIIRPNYSIIIKLFLLILIIFLIVLIRKLEKTIIYNIDKEEIEIFTWKTTLKYKKYEIDKIKVMKVNNTINSIVFKKNKNNFKLYFRENPYLIKIYNTSLTKLFN
ncbi:MULTISPECIES: hypothetical protein [unclassified Clostridium]|uniref:hypothetical protein n=1 Tax=unclassified Clostridium TaxID=2614128 RepID=UPI00280B0EF6|nr:hypothetical protein [Clostridium sp.]MCI6692113.1 hypothetical protein [Clostridium sp.]MDY4253061.1 hypothetical protein [Clostridium sp.]